MPRVSVLMPVWNAGPFLEPAVASVLAQTETDLELLAVDDGSTDGSGQALRRLAADDARLRLIDSGQGNEGIATARNRLLDAARRSGSPFVAFLNHDDWARPDRLRRQLALFDDHPRVSVLGSRYRIIDADGKDFPAAPAWPERDLELRWVGLLDYPLRISTLTVRASLLAAMEPAGFDPSYTVGSDFDFLTRALATAREVGSEAYNLPEWLGAYRRHPGGISRRKADLLAANGTRIALAAIERELPAYPLDPVKIARVRAVMFGARPPGWRATLSGYQDAIETYLDLFDAFRVRHHDHPDLAHLRADAKPFAAAS